MVHKKEENAHDSSSGHIQRRVDNLPARVGPGSKLEVALLIVKGEPGDVDGTGGLEDPGRDVGTLPRARHHHVGLVGRVEALTGAETF